MTNIVCIGHTQLSEMIDHHTLILTLIHELNALQTRMENLEETLALLPKNGVKCN